jgi:hypothetical protein
MSLGDFLTPARCVAESACGCEVVRQGLFPAQISNFWSSFLFLFFAALFLIRAARRDDPLVIAWALMMSLLGLGSLAAHGTMTELGMAMDFAGIVTMITFFLLARLLQTISIDQRLMFAGLGINFLFMLWLFHSMHKPVKIGLCLVLFCLALVEITRTMGAQFWRAPGFQRALVSVGVGFSFFILDEIKVGCDPVSLLPAHGPWHLGASLSLYFYGRWRLDSPALIPASQSRSIGS